MPHKLFVSFFGVVDVNNFFGHFLYFCKILNVDKDWGSGNVDLRSIVFVTPYKESFSLFDQYLVVFGLLIPKEKRKIITHKNTF